MRRGKKILIPVIPAVLFFIPILMYWVILGRIESIAPKEAIEILNKNEGVLIDIRDPAQFTARHIEGALNIPLKELNSFTPAENFPDSIRNKKLLLICNSGMSSAHAVKILNKISITNVYNVSGGMQAWISVLNKPDACKFRNLLNSNRTRIDTFHDMNFVEQWIAFGAAFFIKPLYLVLSFLLFILAGKLHSHDSRILRYSILFFFLGEMFCAVNYIFYTEQSYLFEYLHIYGMIMSFCLITYALTEAFDTRLVHFSERDKRCSLLNQCKICYKYNEADCKLSKLFRAFILSFMVITLIPFLSSVSPVSYNTSILDYSYNYSHPVIFQILESKILPVISLIFFVITYIYLIRKNNEVGRTVKFLFAGGAGFLGFSMLRVVLLKLYSDNLLWFVVAEEVTELVYILNIAFLLWIFKKDIYIKGKAQEGNEPAMEL
jgi:rhodanese-related sulfurtransferase